VLSTLHTNDAPSAITRLIDIGVASYKIATAVKGVLAQRLVRRVCTECSGDGCARCHASGYRGRIGLFELLRVTDEFRDAVAARAPRSELRAIAERNGMTTLRADGLRKAAAGNTTRQEVDRVVPA
jgi:general secretion pathway protein E